MKPGEAELFERCMSVGGVAVFPTDAGYGLACEPEDKEAVRRVHALRGGARRTQEAVMFFDVSLALEAVPEVGPRTLEALGRILPGPVTAVVPNPALRFPLACAEEPTALGLRVPMLDGALAPLGEVRWPVLQALVAGVGEVAAMTIDEVPLPIREGCDLVLDCGELIGIRSTVVDLRSYEESGTWTLIREGAMTAERLAEVL